MRRIVWNDIAPGAGYHAAYVTLSAPDGTSMHDHDFAEAFWVSQGSAVHRVGDEEYRLQPGDCCLMRPHDAHAIDAVRSIQFINVAFPVSVLRAACEIAEATPFFEAWWSAERPLCVAELAMEGTFRTALAGSLTRAGAMSRYTFLGQMVQLLRPNAATEDGLPGPPWLLAAMSQLRDDAGLRAGLAGLRRVAGVSPEHFGRTFRQFYGESPSEYVLRARLERAQVLLRSSQMSVGDIADTVGIRNAGHFFRAFRQRYGRSPRQARRSALAHVRGEA